MAQYCWCYCFTNSSYDYSIYLVDEAAYAETESAAAYVEPIKAKYEFFYATEAASISGTDGSWTYTNFNAEEGWNIVKYVYDSDTGISTVSIVDSIPSAVNLYCSTGEIKM